MGVFNDIRANFNNLMTVQITSVTTGSYHESNAVDLKTKSSEPASIWDKCYSIQIKGMDTTDLYINAYADLIYNVVLQIGYELNYDNKDIYQFAQDDVAEIIRKRIQPTSWTGTNLVNVTHKSTSGFEFAGKPDSETFSVVEVEFEVTYRVTF